MEDRDVSLDQLKNVYKAQTEAYLEFNMALISIVSNQKDILAKVENLKIFSEDEFNSLSKEYYSLEKLFSTIGQSYINNTEDVQNTIKSYLTSSQELNQKLNDLTQIINGVTEDMLSSTSELDDKVKAFDKQNKEQQLKLQYQNKVISSNQASTELNKQMVKFTEQKAKYSNNLLGLYSFLNIVALGLLVYVYKSARD